MAEDRRRQRSADFLFAVVNHEHEAFSQLDYCSRRLTPHPVLDRELNAAGDDEAIVGVHGSRIRRGGF